MKEFKGRVAVVTGAASGIGLALAERFAAAGMKVEFFKVEREGAGAHGERELCRARHLPGGQRGIGQRAIGDELALRDQDDAGDGEHQHQRQAEQRIDRAIGDAVL